MNQFANAMKVAIAEGEQKVQDIRLAGPHEGA